MHAAKVLNRVIDSLDLRLGRNRQPSTWLTENAVTWRTQFDNYQPGAAPVFYELQGLGTFTVQPGRRPYEFTLINRDICDIRIWNPEKWKTSQNTGQFYVQFRSVFMQFHGLVAVRKVLDALSALMYGAERMAPGGGWDYCRVSGADLAADLSLNTNVTLRDLDDYVCLARMRDHQHTPYSENTAELLQRLSERERRYTPPMDNKGGDIYTPPPPGPGEAAAVALIKEFAAGVDLGAHFDQNLPLVSRSVTRRQKLYTAYFGRFGSKLFARLYNKLASLPVQGKEYMLDVWTLAGWDAVSPVWRTEFSLSGDFLKSFSVADENAELAEDLRELDVFERHIPDLWHYSTHSWLRHCSDTSTDTNTTRWQTSPMWAVLQTAFAPSSALSIEREHWTPAPEAFERQLLAQATGVAVTVAALHSKNMATEDIHDALPAVAKRLVAFLESDDAKHAIDEKRKLYGWDVFSDAQLRTHFRAERMAQGAGS